MRLPLTRRRDLAGPLDCEQVRELMQSFLDGELPTHQHGLVADHLHRCEACGIEAATYERVKAAISSLRRPSDADAIARLRGRVEGLAPDR